MTTTWLMPWGQLAWLRAADPEAARAAFDTPNSFVIGGPVPGYAVTPVRSFTSFDAYANASVPTGYTVLYDLENGSAYPAPLVEKQHPAMAFAAFASLARRFGHLMIAAPARDLVYAAASDCAINPGEDISAAYLRTGIPAAAGPAHALLVQAQGVQKDPAAYATLIGNAAAQQPAGQALWAELTTGGSSTYDHLISAYQAVPNVTGFWLTIDSQANTPVAARLIRAALSL